MKKIYFLFLTLIATVSYSQIVAIPDANFKAKLLSASPIVQVAKNLSDNWFRIDSNNDGQIQLAEAQQVSYLSITNSNISNLIGIASFTNLKSLSCESNQITSLNVSMLPQMEYLDCFTNPLTSLNVSGLIHLEYLDCSFTGLTSLDVSGLTALDFLWADDCELASINLTGIANLTKLYAYGNYFTTLDLSNLTNLVELRVSENNLTSIDVAGMNDLEVLEVGYNQLTSIAIAGLPKLKSFEAWNNHLTTLQLHDLPELLTVIVPANQLTAISTLNLPKLTSIYCSNNQLTELDFSTCPLLKWLQCNNNSLQSINIKNGAIQVQGSGTGLNLRWNDNPNLTFVCADENEIDVVQQILVDDNLSGVNINTYCSFTPGGAYNTIAGNVALDDDNNGCDAGDLVGNFLKFRLVDGSNTAYAFTNGAGNYQFYTGQGIFALYPDFEIPSYFTTSPPVALANFPTVNNTLINQDFCITPNGVHPDLEIVLVPVFRARPGFDAIYELVYKNKGNQVLSGNVNLTYADNVLDYVAANPAADNAAASTLSWNYFNLRPFENRKIRLTLHVNSPQDNPAVNSGDVLDFTVTANPIVADETPSDNFFTLHQTVVNSFDPNDKICLEGNTVAPEKIGDYLHYTINFENTGTAAAQNIVVKDIIDIAKFDLVTLQVLNASHSVAVKITGNKVEFIFENINLAALEHGNVVFKIKTKNDLVIGNSVSNKADIFFDYNFPIATNTATSVFQFLLTQQFETDHSVTVFPNPASDVVTIKSNAAIKSIQLFDVQGRVVLKSVINEPLSKLDISQFSKGIYFVKVITDNGMKTQKLIRK